MGVQLVSGAPSAVAAIIAAAAPDLPADRAALLLQYCRWSFALDDRIDGVRHAPAAGAPSAAELTAELADIVDRFRGMDPDGQMTRRFREALGDAVSAGRAQMRLARAYAAGRCQLPSADAFLDLAGRSVNYRSFAWALLLLQGEAIGPHVYSARRREPDGDIVSLLAAELDDDRWVRDDVVAMFVAGTETTALTLTWLWLTYGRDPDAAKRMADDVSTVVGDGLARPEHLPRLGYTRTVLHEVLRLYPAGWIIPRTLVEDDVLDGVPLRAGSTVLVSPYLTHRLAEHWDRPEEFRPDRFAPGWERRHHRYAYVPFGAGPHQCLGSHFFMVEAQLVVAALLSRYRPTVSCRGPVAPRAAATLRPRGRVEMTLQRA